MQDNNESMGFCSACVHCPGSVIYANIPEEDLCSSCYDEHITGIPL